MYGVPLLSIGEPGVGDQPLRRVARYGHTVFLDQVELAAGDELITRLEYALRTSQAGVLVWSNASRDSAWVRQEYQVMEAPGDKTDFSSSR